MKIFNPGRFRHKISFLTPPVERDSYGEPVADWPLFKGVNASKEPLLGRELYTALTADTKVEVKFRTRYIEGITNNMRIRHGNDIYEIISAIDVDCAHKELLCYCKAAQI